MPCYSASTACCSGCAAPCGTGRARRARARCVPDRRANHGQPRSLVGKSLHRSPGLIQVIACAVSAFQAGHEGSIPFARSTEKPLLSVLRGRSSPGLTRRHLRSVPHTCHTASGSCLSWRSPEPLRSALTGPHEQDHRGPARSPCRGRGSHADRSARHACSNDRGAPSAP
jgi:hypothetical protein